MWLITCCDSGVGNSAMLPYFTKKMVCNCWECDGKIALGVSITAVGI